MGPRSTVICSGSSLASAPNTFSSQKGRPVDRKTSAAWPMPGAAEARELSASTVEYGWHGGLAPTPTARDLRTASATAGGEYASSARKRSEPKRFA